MRFLNLKLTSPDSYELKIEFREGLNIISIPDKNLFNIFTNIPVSGLYGAGSAGAASALQNISCTINVSSDISGEEISFINNYGEFSIKESFTGNDADKKPDQRKSLSTSTSEGFTASSFFNPAQIQKNVDPVFEKEKIKSLIIDNEVYRLNFPFFMCRESLMQKKEKDLTDLNRDRQLLELKNMKKEKLLKRGKYFREKHPEA